MSRGSRDGCRVSGVVDSTHHACEPLVKCDGEHVTKHRRDFVSDKVKIEIEKSGEIFVNDFGTSDTMVRLSAG